jgi:hypothetical protein
MSIAPYNPPLAYASFRDGGVTWRVRCQQAETDQDGDPGLVLVLPDPLLAAGRLPDQVPPDCRVSGARHRAGYPINRIGCDGSPLSIWPMVSARGCVRYATAFSALSSAQPAHVTMSRTSPSRASSAFFVTNSVSVATCTALRASTTAKVTRACCE